MGSFLRKPQASQVCKYLPCAVLGKLVLVGVPIPASKEKSPQNPGELFICTWCPQCQNLDFLLNFSTGSG